MNQFNSSHCAPKQATGLFALLCLLLGCQSLPLLAQEEDGERSWSLGLALGHGQRDNPLIHGKPIDINAVIDFSWYGERFFFDNGDLGYFLKESNNWSLNLVATFNNERNYYNYLTGRNFGLQSILDSSFGFTGSGATPTEGERPAELVPGGFDISTLRPEELNLGTDLPKRSFALNSGIEFLYISRMGDIQAQVLTDVSAKHEGQEAWLSWSKPWYTRNSEFTMTLGLEWKSRQLVGYYYGVRPDEAFVGRPEYSGQAGTNRFVRFAARHRLTQNLSLVGMVEREFLSSAIQDSPIVDGADVDTFFAGLLYRF
jgi:MipA family protein